MVGLLELFLPHLDVLGSVLLLLQLPDVVDRRLQNGAFVPTHLTVTGGGKKQNKQANNRDIFSSCGVVTLSALTGLISETTQQQNTDVFIRSTYGSVDLGIMVPSSFMRSLMLNLRLLSTADKRERRAEK